jgi:hypothetical protein
LKFGNCGWRPGQANSLETLSLKIARASRVLVACVCNPSYSGSRDQEGYRFKASWRQIVPEILSQKTQYKNRAGGVAQVVECLPSKPAEALSSSPIPLKKKNQNRNYAI